MGLDGIGEDGRGWDGIGWNGIDRPHLQTDRPTDRHTDTQTVTHRQTNTHTDRQTDRQMGWGRGRVRSTVSVGFVGSVELDSSQKRKAWMGRDAAINYISPHIHHSTISQSRQSHCLRPTTYLRPTTAIAHHITSRHATSALLHHRPASLAISAMVAMVAIVAT
jgi:hypothetical protein